MYTDVRTVRFVATRDTERPGSFIFEMDMPLARPCESIVTNIGDAMCIAGQTSDFALFVYKLFRMNFVTEFQVLDAKRFRIVPCEGQNALEGVRAALREPFGDILNLVFEDRTGE